jgi:hypothetical protein
VKYGKGNGVSAWIDPDAGVQRMRTCPAFRTASWCPPPHPSQRAEHAHTSPSGPVRCMRACGDVPRKAAAHDGTRRGRPHQWKLPASTSQRGRWEADGSRAWPPPPLSCMVRPSPRERPSRTHPPHLEPTALFSPVLRAVIPCPAGPLGMLSMLPPRPLIPARAAPPVTPLLRGAGAAGVPAGSVAVARGGGADTALALTATLPAVMVAAMLPVAEGHMCVFVCGWAGKFKGLGKRS